jgi:Common central domain of tyrosinase
MSSNRPDLSSIDPNEQQTIVNLMMQYITDDVVNEHAAAINIAHTYDENFFIWHKPYIGKMENFMQANGSVLPIWYPNTQIPDSFMVVKPYDDGTTRDPLQNPGPFSSDFSPYFIPDVCKNVSDANDLGRKVESIHDDIHNGVGGTMADITQASAAPIFFCWHALVDSLYDGYLTCP